MNHIQLWMRNCLACQYNIYAQLTYLLSIFFIDMAGKGYTSIREEAVRLFNCIQQLESAREPIPLIQGILQTCLDLRPLRDELYCQLIKQTSVTNSCVLTQMQTQPNLQLRYWQLLTCMSCTFLPSCSILRYLRFHLKRWVTHIPNLHSALICTLTNPPAGSQHKNINVT